MTRAVEALGLEPAWVLVDGNACPKWQRPSKAIVDGDAKCRSIAAASIIAKVTRDRIMVQLDLLENRYGFAAHKGYGTTSHLAALRTHGPCSAHRRCFAPVTELLGNG
jgi:ribonuclease HII